MSPTTYTTDDGRIDERGLNDAMADYLAGNLSAEIFNAIVRAYQNDEPLNLGAAFEIEQLLAPTEVSDSADNWAGLVTVSNHGGSSGRAVLRIDGREQDAQALNPDESVQLGWSVDPPDPGESQDYTLSVSGHETRAITVERPVPDSGVHILDHDPRLVTVSDGEDVDVQVRVANHSDTDAKRWLFVDYVAERVDIPAETTVTVELADILGRLSIDLAAGERRRIPITLQPTESAVRAEIEDRATVTVRRE